MQDLSKFFSGEKLYGDEFGPIEIQKWYDDEKEAYANLGAGSRYNYSYHQLNIYYGFNHLPNRSYENVLGFGSAYGDEFKPIAEKIKHLTVIEPSDTFTKEKIYNFPAKYVKPNFSGSLSFPNDSFDLITCLGVLHHIPNVSYIMKELYRCLQPDGFALVREPIVSMGDWTKPRSGMTRHERGIPLKIFRKIIVETGFEVSSEKLCMFPIPDIVKRVLRFDIRIYDHAFLVHLDNLLSIVFRDNLVYHTDNLFRKLSPSSVFYVLKKG